MYILYTFHNLWMIHTIFVVPNKFVASATLFFKILCQFCCLLKFTASSKVCSVLFSCRLLSQVVQATVDYQLWHHQHSPLLFDLSDIPLLAWLLVSLSPLLVVMVNEIVKLHEIRYESKTHRALGPWRNIFMGKISNVHFASTHMNSAWMKC